MKMVRSVDRSIDKTRALWIGIGGIIIAALFYAALNWFDIVDTEDWVGMEGEASTNPYLAMRRVLNEMGAKTVIVERSSDLDAIPKASVLMLGDRRLARMTTKRVANMVAWVQAGGHLIVEAEQPKLDDPLLEAFGLGHIGLKWTGAGFKEAAPKIQKPDDEKNEDDTGVDVENLPTDQSNGGGKKNSNSVAANALKFLLPKHELTEVTYADGANFTVGFTPYQNLVIKTPRNEALMISDKAGLRMVQFSEGRGRVTAVSNFDFMTYRKLAEHDHAEFLWHVVNASSLEPDRADSVAATKAAKEIVPVIMLALRNNDGGLWKWIGQYAWMVVIAFLALLLMWLLRIISRFGPLPAIAPPMRLSLAEHIRAMGRYVGRHRGWASLITASRERFMVQLSRKHPALLRLERAEQIASLEALTQIGHARIQRALYETVTDQTDRRTFTELIRTLKALEQGLATKQRGMMSNKAANHRKQIQPSSIS